MPSGLGSPRSPAARVPDLGERSAFVASQRVGTDRRRARRRARLRRLLPLAVLTAAAWLAVALFSHWLLTTPRFRVATVEVRGASRVRPASSWICPIAFSAFALSGACRITSSR